MYSLIGLATFLSLSTYSLADCFFPNGGKVDSDTACSPNSLVSTCCYDNQACLSNGLCVSDPHNATIARFHRGTCTDKGWKSSNCLRQCLDVDGNGAPVYSCNQTNSDSYCCGENCKCDDDGFETFSGPTLDVYTVTIIGESFTQTHTSSATSASTSSLKASVTSASGTTTSATPIATPVSISSPASSTSNNSSATSNNSSATSDSSSSSSNSTAIGVGVGVGIGAAMLIGAAAFFIYRRRKRNDPENARSGTAKNPAEADNTEYFPPSQKYTHYVEIPAAPHGSRPTPAAELPSESRSLAVELPASPPPAQKSFRR